MSLAPQLLILYWLRQHPQWVESLYSKRLFLWLAKFRIVLFSWLPFSIGDLFYTAFLLWLGYLLYKCFIQRFSNPLQRIVSTIAWFAGLHFVFQILWGLNYHRQPLETQLQLESNYDYTDLLKTTEEIILLTNIAQKSLAGSQHEAVQIPYSRNTIDSLIINGYIEVGRRYPLSILPRLKIKESLYNTFLSYMGYGGYLNPFTIETQVNRLLPTYSYPVTAAHELAHQLGYAAENEANFLGFLACYYSSDPYLKYCALSYALRQCFAELYLRDTSSYEKLARQLNEGVKKNYKEQQDFWKVYDNPVEPLFKKSFDTYLKANNQKNGIASYNYVVGLLVNFKGFQESKNVKIQVSYPFPHQ